MHGKVPVEVLEEQTVIRQGEQRRGAFCHAALGDYFPVLPTESEAGEGFGSSVFLQTSRNTLQHPNRQLPRCAAVAGCSATAGPASTGPHGAATASKHSWGLHREKGRYNICCFINTEYYLCPKAAFCNCGIILDILLITLI